MANSKLFIASYVALWLSMMVLYIAVFLLYRHFGQQLLKRQERSQAGGPELGKPINFTVKDMYGRDLVLGTGRGKAQMVLFASPNCHYCEEVKPIVSGLVKQTNIDLVVVYVGDPESTQKYLHTLPVAALGVSDPARELFRMWKVPGTPFFVGVDPDGVVQRKGSGVSIDRVQSFFAFTPVADTPVKT